MARRSLLPDVRRFALALPQTTEEPHFDYNSFRVRGKIFATVPPDGEHLHIFVDEDQRAPWIAAQPEVFESLRWGTKVVGVRVHMAQASPDALRRLLLLAWRRKAPKGLSASLVDAAWSGSTADSAPRVSVPARPVSGAADTASAGYSATPLIKKLGIVDATRLCTIEAPAEYAALLGPLPAGVLQSKTMSGRTDLVHGFFTRRDKLLAVLARFRREMQPAAVLWVSWPKKASKVTTDITEDTIRELALPMGLVDVKVCAVSEVWSGLKLVLRKELRAAHAAAGRGAE